MSFRTVLAAALASTVVVAAAAANEVRNESLGTSYRTITEALADPDLGRGHVLIVSPGLYEERFSFGEPPITLKSTYETDPGAVASTVITHNDYFGSGPVNVTAGTFAGFTVADCAASASAVSAGGTALVTHCIIRDNFGNYSAGGVSARGNARVLFNEIRGNSSCGIIGSSTGGGVWLSGDALLMGNVIEDNYGACDQNCYAPRAPAGAVDASGGGDVTGGGVFVARGARVVSNVIRGNCGTGGAGVGTGIGGGFIVNNTVVDNRGHGIQGSGGVIANNILAFNDWQGLWTYLPIPTDIRSNLYFQNAMGDPDPGADAVFADPELEADGFHLKTTSPARDAGRDGYLQGAMRDVDGDDRHVGRRVDIGADELALAASPDAPGIATDIDLLEGVRPGLSLETPRPNPRWGAGAADVRFTLPEAATVRLLLYDVRGRLVAERAREPRAAGPHSVRWDPGELPSGGYFVRLLTEDGAAATAPWLVLR